MKAQLLFAVLAVLVTSSPLVVADETAKKLKVVVLMGQSNMVGHAHPSTAWYLTQPMYLPPEELASVKSESFNRNQFYWQGVHFAQGDSDQCNGTGPALIAESKETVKLWRSRVYANFSRAAKASGKKNEWNTAEWGPAPVDETGHFRNYMGAFLHKKIEETGVFERIEAHIESPKNKLHPTVAIKQIAKRDDVIAGDIKRVREIFIKDAKPEDFDGLDKAIKEFGKVTADNRMAYAELVRKHVNMPLAERTQISALGAVTGKKLDGPGQAMSHGPLTIGYTYQGDRCGPEYSFGISFERTVDGPVLLIKCAWGGKSLAGDFRPPSLHTDEAPTGVYWKLATEHIKSVLADLSKYHPAYDPKVGHELAGLVWFQGWNDKGNKGYGEQLVAFIKDFRKEFDAPKLPVVCGLLGHSSWPSTTFAGDVNGGMLYAAQHPDLKGTVDVVNTVKYYPLGLGFRKQVAAAFGEDSPEYKEAERVISRASSKDPVHYYGSTKFCFLTGDAMARKLANLIAGGEPTIHQEAKRLLGQDQ